jgi:multiple sugar transport system ATP-binding protein
MATVTFDHATRSYPKSDRAAVDRLDLEVRDGEFLVLVGPSGCGKTTSLRMLAGLEHVDEGAILIDGKDVVNLPPRDRDIAMVFQNYALYPHMSVAKNMGFALRMAGVPKREIAERVRAAAKILDLEDYLERKPRELSGGQRQRVAMGRAIVRQPRVYLMDEPLSNLDAKLRVATRAQISALQRRLGVTTLYVTHDQVEAMTMGDRVAVMRKGELQQVAPPEELYDNPVNIFVGGFIGSPAMNMLEARIQRDGAGLVCHVGDARLPLFAETLARHPGLAAFESRSVVLGIRPEDLEDAALANGGPRLRGRVRLLEALGSEVLVHFDVAARRAMTDEVLDLSGDALEERAVARDDETAETTLVGRFGKRTRVREGEAVEVAVDGGALHFFDPKDGVAIGWRRRLS